MPVRQDYPSGTACWLGHGAKDPVEAAAFYRELFGWRLDADPWGKGFQAMLGEHQVANFAPAPGAASWLVCLAGDVSAPPDGWRTRFGPVPLADIGRMVIAADAGASVGVFTGSAGEAAVVAREPGASVGAWRLGPDAVSHAEAAVAGCGGTVTDRSDASGVRRLALGPDEALWAVDDDGPPRWLPAFGVRRPADAASQVSAAGGVVVGSHGDALEVSDPSGARLILVSS